MTAPETAPAPKRSIPFVTDATRLARVLFSPGAVFEEQREKPTWLIPWVVISVVVIIISAWLKPYTLQTIDVAIQARGIQAPANAAQLQATVAMFVTPVIFLILALVSAGILYLVLMATGSEARYKGLLSVSIFGQVVFPIQLLLQGIILHVRGAPAEAIKTMQDAQPSLGLNLFVPADANLGPFMETLLGSIGPIPLWGLVIVAIGIFKLEKTSKGAAWTAAIVSFAVMLLVGAGLATLRG